MVALIISCIAMLVPLGVLASKIRNLNQETGSNEMQDFATATSKKTLQLSPEVASVEQPVEKSVQESMEGDVP